MNWASLAELLFDSPVSGIWPVVLLPWLAARLCARASRRLPAINADWRIAAALAAAPGALLCVLIAAAMARSLFHLHPDDWPHFVQHHFIWFVAPILVARAARAWWSRRAELRSVLSGAEAPGERLARIASRVGVSCRALPGQALDCFVAGIARPQVYVSRGTLAALDDAELEAALCHEKGHIVGHDAASYAILAILADLVPAGERAMTAYRQARERRADERAVEGCSSISLASALLVFGRSQPRPVPCMATGASGAWRIEALLDLTAAPQPVTRPTELTVCLLLLAWPGAQSSLAYMLC